MGYKIWRKDNSGWSLAFDTVYPTKEAADEYILELNAIYHSLVKIGDLTFYPYREDIKLNKNGSILDKNIPANKPRKPRIANKKHKKRFSPKYSIVS